MKIEKLQTFLDELNELIKIHGEDAPITIGQMRDIIEESLIRKSIMELHNAFFVTQEECKIAQEKLSAKAYERWLSEHFPITSPLSEIPKMFKETFSGIY